MFTAEDFIEGVATWLYGEHEQPPEDVLNPFYVRFTVSVSERSRRKQPLSTKQVQTIIKFAKSDGAFFVENGVFTQEQLDELLSNKATRLTPYETFYIPREARYLGAGRVGLRFKPTGDLVSMVRTFKPIFHREVVDSPYFDHDTKIWVIEVTRHTIDRIVEFLSMNEFHVDDALVDYFAEAIANRNKPTEFRYDPESGKIVAFVHDNVLHTEWIEHVLMGRNP